MASGTIKKSGVGKRDSGFIQTSSGEGIFFHHSTVQNGQFDHLSEEASRWNTPSSRARVKREHGTSCRFGYAGLNKNSWMAPG